MEKFFGKNHRKERAAEEGFTLIELLVASAILIAAVSGILLSYLRCLELNEVSRNSSLAVKMAQSRLEQIKAANYTDIKPNFDDVAFAITGLDGRGVSYVDDATADLLRVTVSVCWRQKNGRVFGEDINMNGQLDAGEDASGNGILDSPVQLTSRIFER